MKMHFLPLRLLSFFLALSATGNFSLRAENADARALSYWSTGNHDWEMLPGTYRVMVGSSSRDLPLQGAFSVSSD